MVESRWRTPVAMKRAVGAASSEKPKMKGDATKNAAASTSNTTWLAWRAPHFRKPYWEQCTHPAKAALRGRSSGVRS